MSREVRLIPHPSSFILPTGSQLREVDAFEELAHLFHVGGLHPEGALAGRRGGAMIRGNWREVRLPKLYVAGSNPVARSQPDREVARIPPVWVVRLRALPKVVNTTLGLATGASAMRTPRVP